MNANPMSQEEKAEGHTMKLRQSGSSGLMSLCIQYPVPAGRMAVWLAVLAVQSANAQQAAEPVEAAASTPESAASAPAKAQVELQRVEIKGSRGRVKHSNTGTRMDVEIRDVPASVQVVSQQIVEDQSKAQTVNDVLRNVSGVSQNYGASSGNQPNIVLRGFPTAGGVLHDGYLRPGQNSYDWSSIQQIEVLKGPASVLYGQQPNTGGMINILSKKPLSIPLAEMELSAGRWGYQRGTLDLGGPLNENRSVTYRLNMAGESSESFRDYLFERKLFIASALRWDIGPEDSLLVGGDLMNRKFRPDPGLPAPSASAWLGRENWYPGLARDQLGYALPINTYIGYGNWDSDRERSGRLSVEWEHDINESWHLKASLLRDQGHFVNHRSSFLWFQPTDDSGQPAGPLASLLQAAIFGNRFHSSQVNLDLAGEFEARGIKHKLLAGISNAKGSLRTDPQETRFLVAQDPLRGDAWRDPGTVYTLVPNPIITRYEALNSQKHKGLYAQDMMEFGDRWKALIGYRYHIALGNSSVRRNDDVQPDEFTAAGGTPRLGLVWQPSKTVALYAGWSKSFNPNWGRLSGGGQAPPELGTQYEVGLKKDFASGKANLNLSAYRIDKTNVERCAPDSPECLVYVLVGGQRSKGVELDVNGELLPNLRLSMAMTMQDAWIVQDLPPEQGGAPAGDLLTGVPRWMFNVSGSYKVKAGTFAGMIIGGGWNRTADTEGNLPNDKYRIAGSTRLDLLAEYPFTTSTKLQLNINNVTNQINYATPGSGVLVFANKPREAVLTLTMRR